MMSRYRDFVFVSFLFLSIVINFDKKCANSTQRSQSPNSQRLTIVSGKSRIYSPRQGDLSAGNSIVLVIAASLLFISVTIFCRFWGSFCWNSSTLPTDLSIFVTYALPQKFSPYLISTHVCKFAKLENLHNMINLQKLEISQKYFPAKHLLKQAAYLL